MNVRQLREALNAYPDDLEIFVSKDAEGNAFHLLDEASVYLVDKEEAEHGWAEGVTTEEEIEVEGYDRDAYVPRLILWP